MAATPRRVDAARNDERILAGAMRELGRDPGAGMNAIAIACGVSRATLFRRYPTRDALIAALRERAHADLRAAVDGAALAEGTAGEALERLIGALLGVGVQYAFLLSNPLEPGHGEGIRAIARPVEALVARGYESGEFDPAAPPRWWVEVIVAVLQVATRRASGPRRTGDAAELMRRTLAHGLTARCA